MKTYQQNKSLECETSSINSKEHAEKENGEVADKKVNYERIVKLCFFGCVSVFLDLARSLFIA